MKRRSEKGTKPVPCALKVREHPPVVVDFRDKGAIATMLNDGIGVRFWCKNQHVYTIFDRVSRTKIGWMRRM